MAKLGPTKSKDYTVSIIRLIATIFLLTCHLMQFYDLELRKWFNVCVPMFLCISGFLYGQKYINDSKEFFKKSASKLLVDYYLLFFLVLVLHIIFIPDLVKCKILYIIKGLFLHEGGPLTGCGHLWFVSYIFFLYLITPLLQNLFYSTYEKQGEKGIIKLIVLIMFTCIIISIFYISYFISAWINCYIFGYMLGFMKKHNCKSLNIVVFSIAIIAIIMNSVRIYIEYIACINFGSTFLEKIYTSFYNYAHATLGISLCCIFYIILTKLLTKWNNKTLFQILNWSDLLSYDIYLTHQIFIQYPFSLMKITNFTTFNIFIVLLLSVLSAYLIHFLASSLRKLIKWLKH